MKIENDNSKLNHIDDKKLWDIIAGLSGYHAVIIAYRLDIFSILNDKPMNIADLSKMLDIKLRPAEALVNTNLNLGLIELSDNKLKLSDIGKKYLVKSSDTYFGPMFELVSKNELSFEKVHDAVLSNKPQEYGSGDIFESHEKKFELAKKFTEAMHSLSVAPASSWVEKIDLGESSILLDIGGGSGAHTISALKRWPNLEGIVFDIEPVCEVCELMFSKNNLNSRASTSSGDFWNDGYPFSDLHFYSQIFHDWPEDKCKFLAKKSFDSLPSKGKIIIHEMLYDDDKHGPFVAAACSVALLSWTEGKQYSGLEIKEFLEEAGFADIDIIPTFGYWSVIVGTKL